MLFLVFFGSIRRLNKIDVGKFVLVKKKRAQWTFKLNELIPVEKRVESNSNELKN